MTTNAMPTVTKAIHKAGQPMLATSMLAPRCFGSGLEQACGDDGTDPNENHAADEFAALAGPGADPAA